MEDISSAHFEMIHSVQPQAWPTLKDENIACLLPKSRAHRLFMDLSSRLGRGTAGVPRSRNLTPSTATRALRLS
ncbi:unnamed protein product [Arctogadus glacialis]